MTKKEAKSHAWFRAGLILENLLDEGWPFQEKAPKGDNEKLANALKEIAKFCGRKASTSPKPTKCKGCGNQHMGCTCTGRRH